MSLGSRKNSECRPLGSCSDDLPKGMCGSILLHKDKSQGYKNLAVARFTSLPPQVVCSTRVSM